MTIAREEIFGPVLARSSSRTRTKPIARANDTIYGLAAAVWTRDIKKAHAWPAALQAGTVWINTYNVYDTAAPVRRLQAERLRPRDGHARAGTLHAGQERVRRFESVTH